ncbi:MAG: sugar transferase [Bacteroidales bacterium]|nr:sugar transferase [Bacteroidales bacterium]
MKKKQTAKYIVFDTLSAMLAWASLFLFRKIFVEQMGFHDAGLVFCDTNFWLGLVLVPIGWLSLYTLQGTYRNVLRKARVKELIDTAVASLIGVIVIFFVLLIDDEITNYRNYYASFLFLLAVHFLLTYALRVAVTSQTARKVHTRQLGFPTLLVGGGPKAYQTYLDLENQETYSGNLFIGYVTVSDIDNPQLDCVMPRLGSLDDMRSLVEKHHIEEAIIAVEDSEQQRISDILHALYFCGDIIIKITPDARDIIVGSVKLNSIFHSPLIVINNRLMEEWQYSVKRIADIVISIIALVLLSPVFLLTALIVKFTSPGPVFYAQERVGYHGKPFKMHKFRSMYIDAEDNGPALSKDDDPRITPFGRFMRKVRLDEIPQFYNVLKGTMSLVGPRPERQYYIDQIVKRAPEYLLLQRIKPGITSWGQVKYGYASTVDEMVERLRYDLLYLDNMSLTTDLKILVYTVIIIFQGRGK